MDIHQVRHIFQHCLPQEHSKVAELLNLDLEEDIELIETFRSFQGWVSSHGLEGTRLANQDMSHDERMSDILNACDDYDDLYPVIARAIERAGDLRSEGHGRYSYMIGRVMSHVNKALGEPWVEYKRKCGW